VLLALGGLQSLEQPRKGVVRWRLLLSGLQSMDVRMIEPGELARFA